MIIDAIIAHDLLSFFLLLYGSEMMIARDAESFVLAKSLESLIPSNFMDGSELEASLRYQLTVVLDLIHHKREAVQLRHVLRWDYNALISINDLGSFLAFDQDPVELPGEVCHHLIEGWLVLAQYSRELSEDPSRR